MHLKKCPSCNHKIEAIDTVGFFKFDNKGSRVRWIIGFSFLILVWSIMIPILAPQLYQSILLLIYYLLSYGLLYRIYKKNLDSIVYECKSCGKKFIGTKLLNFKYNKNNHLNSTTMD